MMDIKAAIPLIVQISMMLIVGSIGLQGRWSDLGYVLGRPGLLLRGFVAVYIAVPLAAVLAVAALPFDPIVKIGIVIMALSPLAPFAPGKMLKAGAETSFVVGVYVGLLALAVIVVPATLALLADTVGEGKARIGIDAVTWLILTSILLPLAVGIAIGSAMPAAAPRLSKIASAVANLALLVIIVPILFMERAHFAALVGDGALLAIVVTVAAGLVAGHLLGGPDPHRRIALAQAAATRHPGIAAMIAHQNFQDPKVMLAIVLFLLVSIVVSGLYGKWAHKRLAAIPDPTAPGVAA